MSDLSKRTLEIMPGGQWTEAMGQMAEMHSAGDEEGLLSLAHMLEDGVDLEMSREEQQALGLLLRDLESRY